MNILDRFTDKRILIWGYGREGKTTEKFLLTHTKPLEVQHFEGPFSDLPAEGFDIVFKSPGIVMEEEDPKFTSMTELFLELFADRTIGVTGTKGKSTTSSLLYHCLSRCLDRKVILLGNIGLPCLDYYDEIDEDTVVVFELSCHQLAHTKVSPHIAVFLNLFEEHLDYYGTVEKYFKAKTNITTHQTEKDFFFVGENVPKIPTLASVTRIDKNSLRDFELSIPGSHNIYNANFVYRIAKDVFGIQEKAIEESFKSFTGLRHRLEHIGALDGVDFYDDSISTIPEAAIAALGSVKNAKTVILGGMDRGINYDILINYIMDHPEYNYILAYASGKRIFEAIGGCPQCTYVPELKDAVEAARKLTKPGEAVILSPAAASYGYFKNFEERGDKFKEYVGL